MLTTIGAFLYFQSGVFSIRVIGTPVKERNVETARTFIIFFLAFSATCAVYNINFAGWITKMLPTSPCETTYLAWVTTLAFLETSATILVRPATLPSAFLFTVASYATFRIITTTNMARRRIA
jgi:hypothetical protein